MELPRCHWVGDTDTFPSEHQRCSASNDPADCGGSLNRGPKPLLGITYRHLDVFVQRDKTTGDVAFAAKAYPNQRSQEA